MSTKFTHILYQLEDSGSTYPFYNTVLYPGVPIEASTVPDALLVGLLAKRDIARCDADGNLAPTTRRFAEHYSTDDTDDEPVVTLADSTFAVTQTPVAMDDIPVAPLVQDTPNKTRRGNASTEG